MQLLLRNPVWVFVGVFQPVIYLLLFAPAAQAGAAARRTNADAYQIFVPGLLVLLAIFGGLFQGFGLIAELRAGVIERSRVTPVSRLALLLGRSLRDVVSLLAQAVHHHRCWRCRSACGCTSATCCWRTCMLGPDRADDLGRRPTRVALKVQERGRAGPADEHGGPAGAAALRHPAAADASPPAGCSGVADWNPFSWAVDGIRALFAGDLGDDRGLAGPAHHRRARRARGRLGAPASSPAASADGESSALSPGRGAGRTRVASGQVPRLTRDRTTWLIYAQLGLWGFFLYGFGPVVPLLRDEQGTSAAVASLHSTAIAVGALLGGALFAPTGPPLRPRAPAIWARPGRRRASA